MWLWVVTVTSVSISQPYLSATDLTVLPSTSGHLLAKSQETHMVMQALSCHADWSRRLMVSAYCPCQRSAWTIYMTNPTNDRHFSWIAFRTHLLGRPTAEMLTCHADWSRRLLVCIFFMPTICMNYIYDKANELKISFEKFKTHTWSS